MILKSLFSLLFKTSIIKKVLMSHDKKQPLLI